MRYLAWAAIALLLAAGPAGAAPSPSRPSARPAAAAPPAPPAPAVPALPPVELAFASYAAFQADVSAIGSGFTQAADVERALDRIATYNAAELSQGFIAYAALLAASEPTFAAETAKVVRTYGREATINGFANSGAYVLSLTGAPAARDRALMAARLDGERLDLVGQNVRSFAGQLRDGPAWGRARVRATREARLARLRTLFASSEIPAPPAGGYLAAPATLLSWAGPTAAPASSPTSPIEALAAPSDQTRVVHAIMSVAALQSIGAASATPKERLEGLLRNPDLMNCFERARLQLIQCVSAGEYLYENAACVGEAGLQTRGLCLSQMSRAR